MKKILKYQESVLDYIIFDLPSDCKILKISSQIKNTITLWALVDTDKPIMKHKFTVHETGHEIDKIDNKEYVETVFDKDGLRVWHIFKFKENE